MAEPDFKYIAVYNWGRYQERIKGMEVRRPFIRDAVSKDSDPDYCKLSCLQRYVLDGCRRLVALHGHNLPNDPTWVSRALVVANRERSHVAHAVNRLITDGLLLLTNQRDPFSKELNRTEGNVNKPNHEPPAEPGRQEQTDQDQNQNLCPCGQPAVETGYCSFKCEEKHQPQSKAFQIEDDEPFSEIPVATAAQPVVVPAARVPHGPCVTYKGDPVHGPVSKAHYCARCKIQNGHQHERGCRPKQEAANA